MHTHRRLTLPAVFVVVILAWPAAAWPATFTVGTGTPASCSETTLRQALLAADTGGGGTIKFKCGRNPVTIGLHQTTDVSGMRIHLLLPHNTTLDGGSLITLDGTLTGAVGFVDNGRTATLLNLQIVNGLNGPLTFSSLAPPAGGIVNLGTLTVRNSTLSNNSGTTAGAVVNGLDGVLTVSNTRFVNNVATNQVSFSGAGGIANLGQVVVTNAVFTGNVGAGDGGAIVNFFMGEMSVQGSTFTRNAAQVGSGGGGLANNGILDLAHSAFAGNTAAIGGGVFNSFIGVLTATHTIFAGNMARTGGGAVASGGTVTISHGVFVANDGGFFGGALMLAHSEESLPVPVVTYGIFAGNHADEGGAIYTDAVQITNADIVGNRATQGGGVFATGVLSIDHSAILHNMATSGGGISICLEGDVIGQIPCHGVLNLQHTTVLGNTPDNIEIQ